MILRPQPGAQEAFLATSADIGIYGGAAGGGKSFALLLEPLRHALTNPNFNAVFFRRTTTQIRNPGGLWDESMKLYAGINGAEPLQQPLEWRFKGGGKIKFGGLEHENSVLDWQGSQIPMIAFDELTHFTESQFWYLLSRNRSMSGVRPYVRASCNPDADSWVAKLISWWIDPVSGLPIPSRSGVLRWFIRVNDALIWADSQQSLRADYPDSVPKSLTFVPAKLDDNQALVQSDPGYRANLMAMPLVDRERLLGGNWKIRPTGEAILRPEWWRPWLEKAPAAPDAILITLDTAYTKEKTNDASACGVWHIFEDREVYRSKILLRFAWCERLEFPALIEHLADTVQHFSIKRVPLTVLVEAKANGLSVVQEMRRRLPDVAFSTVVPRDDKIARAHSVTSLLSGPRDADGEYKNGVVYAMATKNDDGQPVFRPWAQAVIDECSYFPLGLHDDRVDMVTMALRHIRDMGLELFSEDEIELPIRPPGPLF